jgi:hypothetical protein
MYFQTNQPLLRYICHLFTKLDNALMHLSNMLITKLDNFLKTKVDCKITEHATEIVQE